MHLLNEVLPAATSCASAADAVADDAMTTSTLSVSFFIGSSSWVRGVGSAAVVAWGARAGQAAKRFRVSSVIACIIGIAGIPGLPIAWRATQSGRDVLDSP